MIFKNKTQYSTIFTSLTISKYNHFPIHLKFLNNLSYPLTKSPTKNHTIFPTYPPIKNERSWNRLRPFSHNLQPLRPCLPNRLRQQSSRKRGYNSWSKMFWRDRNRRRAKCDISNDSRRNSPSFTRSDSVNRIDNHRSNSRRKGCSCSGKIRSFSLRRLLRQINQYQTTDWQNCSVYARFYFLWSASAFWSGYDTGRDGLRYMETNDGRTFW